LTQRAAGLRVVAAADARAGPGCWASGTGPVSPYVFDVLELDGRRLLAESYDVRRDVLLDLGLGVSPAVEVPPPFADVAGAQLLDVAREHRIEGVVAKRRGSRYEPGRRSAAWVKTRSYRHRRS